MDIQWTNFLSSGWGAIALFYLFLSVTLFFAYRSMISYIISMTIMVTLPSMFLFVISLLGGHGSGGHGYDFFYELFFVASLIHTIFFSITLFVFRNKKHKLEFFISFFILIFTFQNIYVNNYVDEWEHNHIAHPRHDMIKAKEVSFLNEELIRETENLEIIDIHMGFQNRPVILDNNHTLHIVNDQIIHDTTLDKIDRFITYKDVGISGYVLFGQVKDKQVVSIYKLDEKSKKYIYDVNESKYLTRLSHKKLINYIGNGIRKQNEEGIFKLNTGELCKLDTNIKYIVYNRYKQTLFVVYKSKNGLYKLYKNPHSKYTETQSLVRALINKAILPKCVMPKKNIVSVLQDKYKNCSTFDSWQKPDIHKFKIDQIQFNKLRKYLMKQYDIDYTYKVYINDYKANIVVTSSDRKDMRLIFRLRKDKVWYITKILLSSNTTLSESKIFGGTNDIEFVKDEHNSAIVSFYSKAFDKAVREYILAKNPYQIFKASIKYRFALRYMEKYGNLDKYIGYRKKRMYEIAKEMQSVEKLDNNNEILKILFSRKLFEEIVKVQKEIINNHRSLEINDLLSTERLYNLFKPIYFMLMQKNNYFNDSKLARACEKYEPTYTKIIIKEYYIERLHQIENALMRENHIKKTIKEVIKEKKNINQKIDFRISNMAAHRYPIIMAIQICDISLMQKLLKQGALIDLETLEQDILFDATLCHSPDIIRLLMSHGADITRNSVISSQQRYIPFYEFLSSNICVDNGAEILAFLEELRDKDIIKEGKYYNAEKLKEVYKICPKDWNNNHGYTTLKEGFFYTNTYVTKEKLKEYIDIPYWTNFIEKTKILKIRDIEFDPNKDEQYNKKQKVQTFSDGTRGIWIKERGMKRKIIF